MQRIENYSDFWPFYLSQHQNLLNRRLHFVGTSLGLVILARAFLVGNFYLVLPALISGYTFAWFGHFNFEKNRPATFQYPLWSFLSDFRMWFLMLLRKPL